MEEQVGCFINRSIQEDRIWHNSVYFHAFIDLCLRLDKDGVYVGKLQPMQNIGGDTFIYDPNESHRHVFKKACNWLRKYDYITAEKVSKPYGASDWLYKVELGDVGKKYIRIGSL